MSPIQVLGEDQVRLLHLQLEHPSLHTMNKMFPNQIMFDLKILNCEICGWAKHGRTTYFPSRNISIAPFMIVHFDVWRESSSNNINGQKWFLDFIHDFTRFTRKCLVP